MAASERNPARSGRKMSALDGGGASSYNLFYM
jgi:hypothetical protein